MQIKNLKKKNARESTVSVQCALASVEVALSFRFASLPSCFPHPRCYCSTEPGDSVRKLAIDHLEALQLIRLLDKL